MGALSALGARGYKTTTGIVGVEVDPEAPETLRHLLKKILRVSFGPRGAVGDGGEREREEGPSSLSRPRGTRPPEPGLAGLGGRAEKKLE